MANGENGSAEGPGAGYVGWTGTIIVSAFLFLVTLFCFVELVALWPHPTPSGDAAKSETSTTGSAQAGGGGADGGKGTQSTTSGTNADNKPASPASPASTTSTATSPSTATSTSTTTSEGAKGAKPATTTEAGKSEEKGTATTGSAPPKPTEKELLLIARQKLLCESGDTNCERCVAREAQLQIESKRAGDPQCIRVMGKYRIMWQEERLLLLVLLAGALGGLLHAMRSLIGYVGNRKLRASWLVFYYLAPIAGATLGCVIYLVIRGGFFSSQTTTADTNAFMFVAVAALAGLFSQQVLEKLRKVSETLFEAAPKTRDTLVSPKPVVTDVTPTPVPVGAATITVAGTGFVRESVVQINGQSAKTKYTSEKELTADPPATTVAAAGTIEVAVANPETSGGTSAAIKVEVK